MKKHAIFAGAVSLIIAAALAAVSTARPPSKTETAVRDPEVIDAAGYKALLERSKGKPLFVNFWATWCEPCRDEFPLINALAKQYESQGLRVVAVSLDDDIDMNLVRKFLEKMDPVFPNFRKKPKGDEEFINGVDPKWSGVLPASFFYSKDGRMVTRLLGEHTKPDFERAIRETLGASKTASNRKPEPAGRHRWPVP